MKNKIKQSVETLLDATIIPNWRISNWAISNRLAKILQHYKIDCVIDVGANTGQYRNLLRSEISYTGTIISIEPDPDNAQKLRQAAESLQDKKWKIYEFALGDEESVMKLNIMAERVFNSFLEPDNSATDKFAHQNSIVRTIDVDVHTLNKIIPEIQKEHSVSNIFLKLDTQGYDLKILKGANSVLDKIVGIQTELSFMPIYKNSASATDSLSMLKSLGYEVSGIYPIDEERFLYAVEFDCISLRAEKINSSSSDLA